MILIIDTAFNTYFTTSAFHTFWKAYIEKSGVKAILQALGFLLIKKARDPLEGI